jgi:hypothetical protein
MLAELKSMRATVRPAVSFVALFSCSALTGVAAVPLRPNWRRRDLIYKEILDDDYASVTAYAERRCDLLTVAWPSHPRTRTS